MSLSCNSRLEVLGSVADRLAGHWIANLFQELEVAKGMASLALSSATKNCRNIGQTLNIGLLCEILIPPICHRLTSKGILQVLQGFGVCELRLLRAQSARRRLEANRSALGKLEMIRFEKIPMIVST